MPVETDGICTPATETELAALPESAFDVILTNDGTLEQLARGIDRDLLADDVSYENVPVTPIEVKSARVVTPAG